MNNQSARVVGIVSSLTGGALIASGAAVWWAAGRQLAAERITIPPDAKAFAGGTVTGPLSAMAQAEVVHRHALEATGGRTYSELNDEALEARRAGDQPRAEELGAKKSTIMTASFLRASLFTSVISFGVCLLAVGVGTTLSVVGWAFLKEAAPDVAEC